MASALDEQSLASVSEGIRALAPASWSVDVTGRGPEGFIEAIFEVEALTAGAAAAECESVVLRVLAIAASDDTISWEAAGIERVSVARAPVGDEWGEAG